MDISTYKEFCFRCAKGRSLDFEGVRIHSTAFGREGEKKKQRDIWGHTNDFTMTLLWKRKRRRRKKRKRKRKRKRKKCEKGCDEGWHSK